MEDEEMAIGNRDSLVTNTDVDPTIPVLAVVEHLRLRKATGQLVVHLHQGGIQKVELVERTKVKEDQRERVREILGV